MKVLALTRYGRLGASSRLRTYQYREPLAEMGIDLHIVPLFDDYYVEALYARTGRLGHILRSFYCRLLALRHATRYDAVWIEKEVLPWLPAFVELSLLPSRLPMIVDYDDAVFHRYDQHRLRLVRSMLGSKLDRVMARADLVVVGNDYLAERARAAGARCVEIVPTVVDLKRYASREKPISDTLTIGWIGSPGTAPYLDIVKPVLQKLSKQIALRAVAVGARPDQVSGSAFEASPWSESAEVDDIAGFDIGIMPLPDSPFERGKCGYKLIQYMAMGLPVVASPVGANSSIVRAGTEGLLAETAHQWLDSLKALARQPAMRKSMGQAGRRRVEEGYSLSVTAPRLAKLLS